jgi:hypothetical protein
MTALDNWLDVLHWYHNGDSKYILFDYHKRTSEHMQEYQQRCNHKLKIQTINGYIKVVRLNKIQ